MRRNALASPSVTGSCAGPDEVLRKGSEMVAAGYVLYSTSTLLVYTCGRGVNAFTLDHDLGEFLLSHEDIACPALGPSFAANVGRMNEWHPNLKAFVEYLTSPDAATRRPYSLRYSGALVGLRFESLSAERVIVLSPPLLVTVWPSARTS